ncbi:hypothetical protein [Glycomyces algeriensis]|uniref:Uncharacterized protein n=1 Tax=Glycomyces algeriensis TaxID=256037 RepID=A0A9W6LHG7_9ACTN|nr:hypothetical protein [Glycomyces algeriensis]MDA1365003.1 hypothetical protein [Glycomyces algeriensis]MDR7349936.1 Arc/MetJ-type ribon-helix-helix transcriptional regulator [Glycomyces algeriensis]GLI42646.1 hypothetical protein GALLR39Z86_24960 [Glycomyces algeriensis]
MFIRFRPDADDERIIRTLAHEGESDADVLRRALRSLEQCSQEEQARADAARVACVGGAEKAFRRCGGAA